MPGWPARRGFSKKRASWIRLVTQRALKSKRALQQARMQRAVDTTIIADRRLPQEHRISLVALPRDPRYQSLFRSYRIGSEQKLQPLTLTRFIYSDAFYSREPVSTSLETLLWPNRISESCHDNGPIFSIVPPCFGRIGMKCEYNVPERKSRPLFPADIGLGTER